MTDTATHDRTTGKIADHRSQMRTAFQPPRQFGAVNWVGLWSLAKRQMRGGFADYHYQILGPVVSSLLYLAVFHVAFTTLRSDGSGTILSFIIPGLIIYAAGEKAYENSAATLILDKHERVITDILMAPMTALERSVAYAIGASVSGLSVGLAVAIATLLFAPLSFANPLALVFFALGGTLMQGLIGALVGIWAQKWDQYAAIHTFLLLPLSFLSGVFYQIENLPDLAQSLIRLNPIFYVIDGFRQGMTGLGASNLTQAGGIVLLVDLALFLSVYLCFRRGYRLKP